MKRIGHFIVPGLWAAGISMFFPNGLPAQGRPTKHPMNNWPVSFNSVALWLLFAAFILSPVATRAQGSLTPPGPPAPVMKTLNEIEPRIPILSLPLVITNPGSYYLTTNLTGVSGTNGITVISDNVTIDLRGFTLFGAAGAIDGIHVPGDRTYFNLVLENGTISGWPQNGVDADTTEGSRYHAVNVNSNAVDGLNPGVEAVVDYCVAVNNGLEGFGGNLDSECVFEGSVACQNGDAGFYTYPHCVLVDCVAANNGNDGFDLDFLCSTRDCSAEYNGASGFDINYSGCIATHCVCYENDTGVWAADHCVVRECDSYDNFADGIDAGAGSVVESCSTSYNSGNGILVSNACSVAGCVSDTNNGPASVGIVAGADCSIKNCVATANSVNGIVVTNACVLEGNLCDGNGSGNTGDGGIRCFGSSNRIDNNQLVGNNANGLYLDGSGNTVIHNTARGNLTTQYSVGSGNDVGPIGSAATATSPWANLQ